MSPSLRVLIIDDDEVLRQGYSLVLSNQGYEVFEAANGAQALDLAGQMNPDIILLDVVLPDMDGFEVCKLILEKTSCNDPMVVLISGIRTGTDNRVKGLKSGAVDFFQKPLPASELLARMASMAVIRETRKKLNDKITEKDLLMRKLHHRIKNDLMLVESIITIRQQEMMDSGAIRVFDDLRGRIRSIMAVHECLYHSGDLESISCRSFFDELVQSLYRFLHGRSGEIKLVVDIEDCLLDPDHAMALGMVVTELVANAIKHGYPDGCSGTIKLSLVRTGDTLDLTVEDDGCGFPADFDFDSASALGLALVRTIVENHDGTMMFNPSRMTRFRLSFPFDKTIPGAC
jgi:two-component sensor histidine kinase